MKVEIWSDVMCPFCFIGKRHFEAALESLPYKKEIDVEWKSYQLNPEYSNPGGQDLFGYLAENKGISREQAGQMTGQVLQMAANAGLSLDFKKSIPANTFLAHRLIHFAASKGLQDAAEEALFKAHFQDGKDVADLQVLLDVAVHLGLPADETANVLNSDAFTDAVRYDLYEAQTIGIRGVPYFVLDRKYAVSGAQPVDSFRQALEKSFAEWKATQPEVKLQNMGNDSGNSCTDNECTV